MIFFLSKQAEYERVVCYNPEPLQKTQYPLEERIHA